MRNHLKIGEDTIIEGVLSGLRSTRVPACRVERPLFVNRLGEVVDDGVAHDSLFIDVVGVLLLDFFDHGDMGVCAVFDSARELQKECDGLLCRSDHFESPV